MPMVKTFYCPALLLTLTLGITACGGGGGSESPTSTSTPPPAPEPEPQPPVEVTGDGPFIVVDQFGYLPQAAKIAVLRDPVDGFDSDDAYTPGDTIQVIDTETDSVVFSGSANTWNSGATDTTSGDRAWLFDFSNVTEPGSYQIVDIDREQSSATFNIDDNVYRDVLIQAVRTFFYQRAGHTKTAQHAGAAWADDASHLGPLQDANARRYDAAGDAGSERDLSGGWYDAGDYNKYTNWTSSYVVALLHTYAENPGVWSDDFNIPESGNGVPDLLDEIRWGLDSLRRMQNAEGSVLSIVGLASASPPSAATGQSLYGDASTSATLSATAAFAYGAKIFAAQGSPTFSEYAADLAARAERAWRWTADNPAVAFRNNDEATGTAGLGAGQQEVDDTGRLYKQLIAAIYLYDLTGKDEYRIHVDNHYTEVPMIKSWWLSPFDAEVTRALLYYTALDGATRTTVQAVRERYTELWNGDPGWGAVQNRRDPYGAFITDYTWGSNGVKSLAGGLFADQLTYGIGAHSAQEIRNAGAGYLHYLHGVNPLGKVYLSNMREYGAENSVDQFYHTWFADGSTLWDSVKDSVYGPPPGFLVGGPNPYYDWDERCPGVSTQCGSARPAPPYDQPAQKSYADFNTSWPLNSWSVTENSNGYQTAYIRLLARYVKPE